jgi:cell division protein FtsI/penicillin-binding protein 2
MRDARTLGLHPLWAGALIAGVALSGCSFSSGPSPDPAARKAAAQLSAEHLTDAAWSKAATAQAAYAKIFAGMDVKPSVKLASTKTDGDHATAKLDWSWPIGSKAWTYTTSLALTKSGDDWTAAWAPTVVDASLASGDRLRQTRVAAKRGNILGAGGTAIVKPRPVLRFGLNKAALKTTTVPDSATALAQLVGIDVKDYVKLAKASGPKAFVPAITFREGEVPTDVQSRYLAIKGAVALHAKLPLAPTKAYAAALLGTVGPATAEIVKQSKGRVVAGDDTGLSGLQERYDAQLAGSAGGRVDIVHSDDSATKTFEIAPVAGKALQLTLVPRMQQVAEQVLANVGPASALVAIKPSTGAVVAAASGPGSKGYDTATYGQYAPGSTFKMIDSLALLRSGLTPSSPVTCTTSLTVNGKKFTNDSEYPAGKVGRISLTDALANSCNTAFISQHGRLKGSDLQEAAAALGFGVDHNVGFPAYFGQIPAPASEVEKSADMIGQGKVLASPMAMSTVMSSILAGHAVVPHLVEGQTASASPDHPLTKAEATKLRAMLRAVVTEPTGTGHGLFDVPGAPVIAKTGTAEFGTKPPLPTHAWMVAGQGDLAVAVFVDEGHTGAGVAGPILESFLRAVH